jgi:DNA-binding transcriptional ArsR family regulator
MEMVLWQALAGTRGGPNRARILKALDERPRNANQLAEDLELAYNTVQHRNHITGRRAMTNERHGGRETAGIDSPGAPT